MGSVAALAFDLETTGLDPENDRIVEFCFIEVDAEGNEISRWTERVNPGVPIPEETTAVHGIVEADISDLPGFEAHAERIQKLVAATPLMAYNHGFDMNTLHYELVRHGQPGLRMDHPVIDPFIIFRENHPHTLAGAVQEYLGEALEDAHSAEADAAAMLSVFRAQTKAHGLPTDPTQNLVQRDRKFLDRGRRLYEDEEGVPRFGFGKYRDAPVKDHIDYLQWILAKDFPEDTKNAAARLVDRFIERPPDRKDLPSGQAMLG